LSERHLRRAVGVMPTQPVYPADVMLRRVKATARGGWPAKHPVPSHPAVGAAKLIEALPPRAFRMITWRHGTRGPLKAAFAVVRVRVGDGPLMAQNRHQPGDAAWLVCERRASGERKYYLADHPEHTSRRTLVRTLKQRWVCEQMHQQMKEELGLDHFEGRSWRGLHHHALMCMLAFAFLQHLRLRGEKNRDHASRDRATAAAVPTGSSPSNPRCAQPHRPAMPALRLPHRLRPAVLNVAE
jgi:SRSO17 transposase